MTFSKWVETRLLVEHFHGICKASDWVNDMCFRKQAPERSFEKSNDGRPVPRLVDGSIVSNQQIATFKEENPRVQIIVVYEGTFLEYSEMLNLRFNMTKRNVLKYFKFLALMNIEEAHNFQNYSEEVFEHIKENINWSSYVHSRQDSTFDMLSLFKQNRF